MHAVRGTDGAHPVVLFDGSCNLCHRLVAFLSRVDKEGALRFAPRESDAGRSALLATGRDEVATSGLVLIEDGRAASRSEAVWRALSHLRPPWPTVAAALRLVPREVRDAAYDLVARHRYRFFGRADRCPLPPKVHRRAG